MSTQTLIPTITTPRHLEMTRGDWTPRTGRRAAVEICNVSKSFGRHLAVDDLKLRVPEGSICGFIGPNGSGKTTSLRLIMRIYHPDNDGGVIRVLGQQRFDTASDRIGYLPEERGLYKRMKVSDCLRFYAELKGCKNVRQDVQAWLERMQLTEAATKRVEALSKGMAQKVQFIATVINRPDLIILDEPFSGLDPINTEVIRDTVLDLRRQGATIIFSTHDMDVAEKMCDFIVMIYKGKKVLDGTLEEIQNAFGQDTIRVKFDRQAPALNTLPGVEEVTDFGRYQELRVRHDCDSQRILTSLMNRGCVTHFEIAHPRLHDVFVRIAKPSAEPFHA